MDNTIDKLWVEARGRELSPLGRKVHRILDYVFNGIYHRQKEILHERVKWHDPYVIEMVMWGELATYDFGHLTRLVLACHEECVRLEIKGASAGYSRLFFSNRDPESNSITKGHPSSEEALETFIREYR